MGKFNLNDYETVADRIRRFKAEYPDSRIETQLVEATGPVGNTRWTVKASIWRDRATATGKYDRPDATGWAMEIDGTGMANNTSALENCETSAIGRALANLNYSGDKRATREEMEKVQREEARQQQEAEAKQAYLNQQYDRVLAAEKDGDVDTVKRAIAWASKNPELGKFKANVVKVLERMEAAGLVQDELGGEVVQGELIDA